MIRSGSLASVDELGADINASRAERGLDPKPCKCQAKGKVIPAKIRRACATLDKSEAA